MHLTHVDVGGLSVTTAANESLRSETVNSASLAPNRPLPSRMSEQPGIIGRAVRGACLRLNPLVLSNNPVLFIVASLATLVLVVFLHDLWFSPSSRLSDFELAFWLWATVFFGSFAEGLAEARAQARADALRKAKAESLAKRVRGKKIEIVAPSRLKPGDVILAEAGDLIAADGVVIEGIATVDESAITGESAAVIRESASDRSSVTGGTRVVSDQLKIRVSVPPFETFIDKTMDLVEGPDRKRLSSEIVWSRVLTLLMLSMLVIVSAGYVFIKTTKPGFVLPLPLVAAAVVCLFPTAIAAHLSAISIAGIDRLMRHCFLTSSPRAVEALARVNTVLIDKTGTITVGNREAIEVLPFPGVNLEELVTAASLASIYDETTEGRSILALGSKNGVQPSDLPHSESIPFSAYTRMSGVDFGSRKLRKGATEAIAEYVKQAGGSVPDTYEQVSDGISRTGGTPLAVADGNRVLGIIHLEDRLTPGIDGASMHRSMDWLRSMGIESALITGDNSVTAAAIAQDIGVDRVLPQATPADKLAFIKQEQGRHRSMAMIGDGTNDAPALAQADLGLVMNRGTLAAKEAGNMIDLDSCPTKVVDAIAIGKQLYFTRAALTAFCIASSVAQGLIMFRLVFAGSLHGPGQPSALGVHVPHGVLLAPVVWNALAILVLGPLALRGIRVPTRSPKGFLLRSIPAYALAGFLVPFPAIWLIDRILQALRLVQG